MSTSGHTLFRLVLWASLSLTGRLDVFAQAATFALLVAYPGATDIDLGYTRSLRRFGAVASLLGAAAALAPRGGWGGALAGVWLAYTLANLAYGAVRFLNTRDRRDPVAWAHAIGHAGPVIDATAWVFARTTGDLAGYGEPITTLTVVHFHLAFGALPLALGAWTAQLRPGAGETATGFDANRREPMQGAGSLAGLWDRLSQRTTRLVGSWPGRPCHGRTGLQNGLTWALAALLALPLLLGLLFATRAEKGIAGIGEAGAAALMVVALAGWVLAAARAPGTRTTGPILRGLAGALLLGGFTLGAAWALRLATGAPFLDFAGMARTHGALNALGTLLLTLTAARYARSAPDCHAIPDPADVVPLRLLPPGHGLFRDDVTETLGPDSPDRFAAARVALLTYDFYPVEVMHHHTSFRRENRLPRIGDRIGMLLRVRPCALLPELRLPAVTEIHCVEDGPDRVGLGYVTTLRHYGTGEWTATILRADDVLKIRIQSRMTPCHWLAWIGLPLYRHYQVRARTLGIQTLRERLNGAG